MIPRSRRARTLIAALNWPPAQTDGHIYVAARGDVDRSDPFWNETSFSGASLPFSDLVSAEDHYGAAVAFLDGGCARLNR